MKILVSWTLKDREKRFLENNLEGHELFFADTKDEKDIITQFPLGEIDILVAGRASKDIIDRCESLKFIQSMIAGVSHIDLKTAEKRDLPVASAKGANFAVAEHAIALILSLLKNIKKYFQDVRRGVWDKNYSGIISGKIVGIVGLGNIGSRVAKQISSLGADIAAVSEKEKNSDELDLKFFGGRRDLNKLLSMSDIVVVSVPKTDDTISLIDKQSLDHIKEGSYLVNICRGPVVELNAVREKLEEGKLSGFATDVFPNEPYDFSNPIFERQDVIATPHVAANNPCAKIEALKDVVNNIESFESGENISHRVNFELGY